MGQRTLTRIVARQRALKLRQNDAQIKPVMICALHDIRQRAATCSMSMQRCFTCIWLERQHASTDVSIYCLTTF